MKTINLIILMMFFMNLTSNLNAQESQKTTYTAQTTEGYVFMYIIVDEAGKKAAIGSGEKFVPAIQPFIRGRFTVPNEVNGYKVIQIGDYAFTGCQLDTVIIPEGMETIEHGAFESCNNLQYVSIPSTVKKIGTYAFFAGKNLKSVISHIQNPQNTMEESVFDEWVAIGAKPREIDDYGRTWLNGTYQRATLYVPKGTKELYQESFEWQEFDKIEEMESGDTNAINAIENDASTSKQGNGSVFDLTGRRLSTAPQRGIYIQDGRKVMVK